MSTTEHLTAQGDVFWWQGARMEIKARAADTDGAIGLVEGRFPQGFGPPLHVHRNEDEAFYVLEGEIRFRQGDEEVVAGAGAWVWGPRGVPHAFKVESETARALVVVTPGGFEEMFAAGGTPASAGEAAPAPQPYDPAAAAALAEQFAFDVVGPSSSSNSPRGDDGTGGRTWDRTRPSADRVDTTPADSAHDVQGNDGSDEGGPDRPGTTRSDSALGHPMDSDRPRLGDDPRSQRGPSSEPPGSASGAWR